MTGGAGLIKYRFISILLAASYISIWGCWSGQKAVLIAKNPFLFMFKNEWGADNQGRYCSNISHETFRLMQELFRQCLNKRLPGNFNTTGAENRCVTGAGATGAPVFAVSLIVFNERSGRSFHITSASGAGYPRIPIGPNHMNWKTPGL